MVMGASLMYACLQLLAVLNSQLYWLDSWIVQKVLEMIAQYQSDYKDGRNINEKLFYIVFFLPLHTHIMFSAILKYLSLTFESIWFVLHFLQYILFHSFIHSFIWPRIFTDHILTR